MKTDRINHVRVVALALLASFVIMLIGMTARATDDVNGYGIAAVTAPGVNGSGETIAR